MSSKLSIVRFTLSAGSLCSYNLPHKRDRRHQDFSNNQSLQHYVQSETEMLNNIAHNCYSPFAPAAPWCGEWFVETGMYLALAPILRAGEAEFSEEEARENSD
jgi:hypothetical protein